MKGELKTALDQAEKAAALTVEIGAKKQEGMTHRLIGTVYRDMGELDKAMVEFEKGNELLGDAGDKKELARLLYERAFLLKTLNEPEKAIELLEQAREMFKQMGMRLWEEKCGEEIGKL